MSDTTGTIGKVGGWRAVGFIPTVLVGANGRNQFGGDKPRRSSSHRPPSQPLFR
jgi:hypothetical protein